MSPQIRRSGLHPLKTLIVFCLLVQQTRQSEPEVLDSYQDYDVEQVSSSEENYDEPDYFSNLDINNLDFDIPYHLLDPDLNYAIDNYHSFESSDDKNPLNNQLHSWQEEPIEKNEEEEESDESFENVDKVLSWAAENYDIDIENLLSDSSSDDEPAKCKGDPLPILERRKRSPDPRRRSSSSSSRSRSSSSSSSRRSSSSSRSSSGSSRGSSSRFRLPWRRRTSSSGSSSSSSGTRRVATGVSGAGGVASGGSKPYPTQPTAPSPYPTQPTGGTAPSPYPTGGTAPSPYPTRPTGGTAPSPYPTGGTAPSPYPTGGTAPSPYPTKPTGGTAPSPYPTGGTAPSPYPTRPTGGTAPSPYPTGGTAPSPYPTGGTAPSPYPTRTTGGTAPSPYPTGGTAPSPYPTRPTGGTAPSPYPTGGSTYPTGTGIYPPGGTYPGTGRPYPTYPTSGSTYPGYGGRPYPTSGLPYQTAGSPYSQGHHPTYPRDDRLHYPNRQYPTSNTYPTSNSFPSGGYNPYTPPPPGYGYSGIKPKKSKTKKVKEVIKAAIAGYAIHKATKKARKGFFSPSVFSSRRHYGSSFGGFGHGGYGHGGYGYGGYGHGGYGHGFGSSSSSILGAGAAYGGAKIAKKILGMYVKMQIAKYALKFGVEAAQIYFRYKLGYDLRDQAIEKFIRQHNSRQERRQKIYQQKLGLSNETALNITLGEDCARQCKEDDEKNCLFVFKVHLYQTLTRACYDCPKNITNCLRPECITGSGNRRLLKVVNRQLPGPAIQVCRGDRVLVEIQNELPSSSVSFHWHGLTMNSDPYMDGVTGLTQCPIDPRESFTYNFMANFPGTHYWHAQEGLLRGEGLYGPLIVRKPDESETQKYFYDYDLSSHVLLMSDLPSRTSEGEFVNRYYNEDKTPPTNILINGRGGKKEGDSATLPYARIDVVRGKRYRLRLINAASLNCPIRVVAPADHNFTVIATDGASITPFYTQSIVVNNGERWDVVLIADQNSTRYWMSMIGEVECEGVNQGVVVTYKESIEDPMLPLNETIAPNITIAEPGANVTLSDVQINDFLEDVSVPDGLPLTVDNSDLKANTHGENCSHPNITCLSEIRSTPYAPLPQYMAEQWVEDTLFLSFGSQPVYNKHFYSLLYYGPEFMPPEKRSKTPQVNNLSLKLPTRPLMLDQGPMKSGVCTSEGVRRKHCVGDYCECIHSHDIEPGEVVELVLVNEGLKNETAPQPIHLHGYRFWVISHGIYDPKVVLNQTTIDNELGENSTTTENIPEASDDEGFTRLHALNLFTKNQFPRNFYHPILKDSIVIPSGGYAIVRFQANNKGFWLGESQVLQQAAAGQAFVLQVGNSTTLPKPPRSFPRC